MALDFSDLGPQTSPQVAGGINFSDLGAAPILPSVQAARDVAARQTPQTGVLPESGLRDKFAAGIISLLNSVGNIPSGALNLAIKASPYFSVEPGVRQIPSQEELQAMNRLADIITSPIQDPYFKTVEALSGQPVNAPGSPIMENPKSALLGELAPDIAMAAQGLTMVPSVRTLPGDISASIKSAGNALSESPLASKLKGLSIENSAPVKAAKDKLLSAIENEVSAQRKLGMQGQEAVANEQAALAKEVQSSTAAGHTNVENINKALQAEIDAQAASRALESQRAQNVPKIKSAEQAFQEASKTPETLSAQALPANTEFGSNVINNLNEEYQAGKAIDSENYTAVSNAIGPNQAELPSKPLFKTANRIKSEEFSPKFKSLDNSRVNGVLNELTKVSEGPSVPSEIRNLYDIGTPKAKADLLKSYPELSSPVQKTPVYTWDDLQTGFKGINAALEDAFKYGNTQDQRILMQLKGALTETMRDYSKQAGSDAFQLFEQANSYHADLMNKFGKAGIQRILTEEVSQNPENVIPKLIKENNPSLIRDVKAIVSPDVSAQIERQYSQELLFPKAGEPFDPEHFVNKFSDVRTHETLKEVYGEEGFKNLESLYNASKGKKQIPGLQKELDDLEEAFTKSKDKLEKAKTTAQEFDAKQIANEKADEFVKRAEAVAKSNKIENANAKLRELERDVQKARDELDPARKKAAFDRLKKTAAIIVIGSAGSKALHTLGLFAP